MKKILFSVLAMAAFAACSNEEQIAAPQGEAITFGAFVDNSVRASEAEDPSYTTTSLDHFDVYGAVNGVNIFDGDEVTGSVGSGAAWTFTDTATPTQYWIPGADYTFHAVVNATDVECDNAGLPLYLEYTADGVTDMLHDIVTTTGKPTENNGLVAFGFTHLLSKVKFTVENTTAEEATNYQYVISDIKITNAYASGNYAVVTKTIDELNLTANTWFDLVGNGTHTIDALTVASAKTEVGASEVLLIPGASVGVSFKVDIQMHDGTKWVSIPMDNSEKTIAGVVTLEANKAYNFKVTLGLGDPIQFTATELTGWENGNTEDSDDDDSDKDHVPAVPAN